jgi:hypothetical protein
VVLFQKNELTFADDIVWSLTSAATALLYPFADPAPADAPATSIVV